MAGLRKRSTDYSEQSRLLRMFVNDGRNVISALERYLAALSSGGFRVRSLENTMRAVHSIKSEAAFLEFEDVRRAAHGLEESLGLLRNRQLPPGTKLDESTLQQISSACDRLRESIGARISSLDQGDGASDQYMRTEGSTDISSLAGIQAHSLTSTFGADSTLFRLEDRERRAILEARRHGELLYRVWCEIDDSEPLTYARLYLLLNNLESAMNVIRTVPSVETFTERPIRHLTALVTANCTEQEIYAALEVDQINAVELTRLDFESVLELAPGADGQGPGLLLGRSGVQLSLTPRNYELLSLYSYELATQLEAIVAAEDNRTVAERRRLQAATRLASRVRSTIQRTSLVPLSSVLEPLHRFVDRLAGEGDKQVRFTIRGERERVFLPVAELIADALLHLIRNCLDHGVESPEYRSAAGKPETASIRLTVMRTGGGLSIELSDDGRGVDESKLRERAGVEKDAEWTLLDLMCVPGASTRSAADVSSGRGVGMDAVRHTVETLLGGTLRVTSRSGDGLSVRMELPEGASLLTVTVFEAGGRDLAVPSCQVIDVLELTPKQIREDVSGDTYFVMGGEAVRVFTVAREGRATQRHEGWAIVLSVEENRGVILADRIVSEEVVVRSGDQPNRVYSKTLDQYVSLFVPVAL